MSTQLEMQQKIHKLYVVVVVVFIGCFYRETKLTTFDTVHLSYDFDDKQFYIITNNYKIGESQILSVLLEYIVTITVLELLFWLKKFKRNFSAHQIV